MSETIFEKKKKCKKKNRFPFFFYFIILYMFIICSFSFGNGCKGFYDQLKSTHPQTIHSFSTCLLLSGTKGSDIQPAKIDIYRLQPTEASTL